MFTPFPNKPWFLRVCRTSLLKTLREKEKLLVTSNFSFSHSVFCPFGGLSAIFIKFKKVVCKLFQFGRVKNLTFGKELLPFPKINFNFSAKFNLSSANAFNLDQSKNLSFGKEFIDKSYFFSQIQFIEIL